jgi:hypothetical protein
LISHAVHVSGKDAKCQAGRANFPALPSTPTNNEPRFLFTLPYFCQTLKPPPLIPFVRKSREDGAAALRLYLDWYKKLDIPETAKVHQFRSRLKEMEVREQTAADLNDDGPLFP